MAASNEADPLDQIAGDDDEALPALQPTEDVGSRKKTERREQRIKRQAAEDEAFLRGVLKDQTGRRVLFGILSAAHAFDTRFASGPGGFPDPNATWMHHGEQMFGLGLYHKWLTLDPQSVFLMLAENDSRFQSKKSK